MKTSACLTAFVAVVPFVRDSMAQCPTTELVSGALFDYHGHTPSFSLDNRYVAFRSASVLVPGDTNGFQDVYLYDRQTCTFERVSLAHDGSEPDSHCTSPAISPDGRFVVFLSSATNLVPSDGNMVADVFVRDRQLGTTERVSVDSSGSEGDKTCWNATAISFDGRYVAFGSEATNLVTGDGNNVEDIFVRDRQLGTTERVSVDSAGVEGMFPSDWPVISHDGRYVAFPTASKFDPNDTNGTIDIYVHDRQTNTTTRASVDVTGVNGDGAGYGSISADGRYVAFNGGANLVPGDNNGLADIFVKDMQTGAMERIVGLAGAEPDGFSLDATISADGNHVAFSSEAKNLVTGDGNGWQDVFVHDRTSGTTQLVSVAPDGSFGNSFSGGGTHEDAIAVSEDGGLVAFMTTASNLVPGVVGGPVVLLRDWAGATPMTYCTAKPGLACGVPAIGATGRPQATASSGFTISAGPARQNKVGLLIYSDRGPNAAAFQGGTLCIRPAVRRTTTVNSGGASLCDGTFAIDMNAFGSGALGGNPQAFLTLPGAKIYAQFWGRDTLASGSFLSDAVCYIICP
jgi:Tol biopolymer transport system component